MQNKNKRCMWIRNEKNIIFFFQEDSEAPGMTKPKEESESYGINQALEAKNGTNLHYWISPSTSLQEKKVELPENTFSP